MCQSSYLIILIFLQSCYAPSLQGSELFILSISIILLQQLQINLQPNNLQMNQFYNPFPKTNQEAEIEHSEQQQLMQLLQSNPQLMKKYQQQLTKMNQNKRTVGSQIPMSSKQYLTKMIDIDKYLDNQGGLLIQPDSGFVLKFYDKRTNQKIFANIVKHEVVDHPQQKMLVDFENQPGLRIPMSMGRVREDTDKNGQPCKVVDVVFNPKIVTTSQQNLDIMMFMAQIIGNYLLEKYKITISQENIKKVKGLKYKGTTPQVQRVKGKKSPKIEQLSTNEEIPKEQIDQEEQLFNKINNQEKSKAMQPQFRVFVVDFQNKKEQYSLDSIMSKIKSIEIMCELDHLIHSKGIHLQGSNKSVLLQVRGIYSLCLTVPLDIGRWSAKFSRKQRKLLIFGHTNLNKKQQEKEQVKQKKKIEVQMENDLLYDIV